MTAWGLWLGTWGVGTAHDLRLTTQDSSPKPQASRRSERQIRACVEPLIGLLQGLTLQPENAVVQAHAQRTDEPYLCAAADVGADVGFLARAKPLAINSSPGRAVELRPEEVHGRLYQHVA